LILFTASAQTHIFPEIRIDAVRFLSIFLECIPEPLVEGWNTTGSSHGKRILEGFLGNLNAGTKFGGPEGKSFRNFYLTVLITGSRFPDGNINLQRISFPTGELRVSIILSFS
jgi:hypothetical protein